MGALTQVILPVFIVLGFGYVSVWRGWFSDAGVEALTRFSQGFAIPVLLFRALSTLDLRQEFDLAMLGSFYAGALAGFVAGLLGARFLFGRSWEDSVAIGFVGLFSNAVLLGLPITERAYGTDALQPNYVIIALHAPFCYAVGITAMELARARGAALWSLPGKVAKAMFSNSVIIGILLGLAVNLGGVPLPSVLNEAVDLIARAALPVALFGLGGVLYRYRPAGDVRAILFICAVSLLLHPAVVWALATVLEVDRGGLRSAVVTAAMAPGVNAYLFANMYGSARRVAASAVLIGTGLCMLSASFWLALLP